MKEILSAFFLVALFAGCAKTPSAPSRCESFAVFETPSTNENRVSTGHNFNRLLDTTWTRGNGSGVKVYLPTDSWCDGVARSTAWRLCEFDENGCLQKVHAQTIRTESNMP